MYFPCHRTTILRSCSSFSRSLVDRNVFVFAHRAHRQQAPAEVDTDSDAWPVPHQIRGFLARFSTILLSGTSYDRCPACSAKVIHSSLIFFVFLTPAQFLLAGGGRVQGSRFRLLIEGV
jgi:hypothetical protein